MQKQGKEKTDIQDMEPDAGPPLAYADIMQPYRARIDALDEELIALLAARADIIREVGHMKYREAIPAVLPDRVTQVRERAASRAAACGLDPDLIRKIYTQLIEYSCALEEEIFAELAAQDSQKAKS